MSCNNFDQRWLEPSITDNLSEKGILNWNVVICRELCPVLTTATFLCEIFFTIIFTLWLFVTGENLDHQLNLTTPMAPSWEATNSLTSTTMIQKTWQGKFSFDPQVLPVVWELFLFLLNPSQGLTWRGRTTPRSVCRPGISWRGAQDTPHLWKYLWGSPVC